MLGASAVRPSSTGRPQSGIQLGDTEPVDDPEERPHAGFVDRSLQVLSALACEAVQRFEILDCQPEEVAPLLDETALQQLGQRLPAGAFDVHCSAADKVTEFLADSSRAQGSDSSAEPCRGRGRLRCRRPGNWPASALTDFLGRFSKITRTTSGITSPALCRNDAVASTRMSLRRTSSRLWRVARATVEPATLTGARWATGVMVPVRPTYGTMSSTTVSTCSGRERRQPPNAARGRPCRACAADRSSRP